MENKTKHDVVALGNVPGEALPRVSDVIERDGVECVTEEADTDKSEQFFYIKNKPQDVELVPAQMELTVIKDIVENLEKIKTNQRALRRVLRYITSRYDFSTVDGF